VETGVRMKMSFKGDEMSRLDGYRPVRAPWHRLGSYTGPEPACGRCNTIPCECVKRPCPPGTVPDVHCPPDPNKEVLGEILGRLEALESKMVLLVGRV